MTDEIDKCHWCGREIPCIYESPMLKNEVWESIGGVDGDFDKNRNWVSYYMCMTAWRNDWGERSGLKTSCQTGMAKQYCGMSDSSRDACASCGEEKSRIPTRGN